MSNDITLREYFNLYGKELSGISIDVLDLSFRSQRILTQRRLNKIQHLLNYTREELFFILRTGSKYIYEIFSKLKKYIRVRYPENYINEWAAEYYIFLKDIPVDVLDLSVRSINGLKNFGIKNIAQLSCYSEQDLYSVSNLGAKSVSEIIKKRADFLKSKEEDFILYLRKRNAEKYQIDENFKAHIEELILNPDYIPENLTEEQSGLFEEIKAARKALGEELSLDAYLNPEKYAAFRNALHEFADDYVQLVKRRALIEKELKEIGAKILNKRLYPFVHAYLLQKRISDPPHIGIPYDENRVKSFLHLFAEAYREIREKEDFAEKALKFASWLNFDIRIGAEEFAQKIDFYETGKDAANMRALKLRASGMTLEEIGEMFGVTRERIRQRERKALNKTENQYKRFPHDLILFIYALEDGNSAVTLKTAKKYLGDIADILFYMLNKRKIKLNPAYEYNYEMCAVVIRSCSADEDILHKLNEFSKSLPRFVNSGVFDLKINNFCRENGINPQFAKEYLSRKRVKYGCMMCDSKPTKNEMFEYVLRMYFSDGYKIADENYKNELASHVMRIFGEDYSGDSVRTTDSVIQRVAVLSGRGFYSVRDYSVNEARVIKAVNRYIENSDRILFNYNELYHKVKKQGFFEGTEITNSHILHGMLNQYGTPYITARDYISKKADYTFLDELEHFAAKKGLFSKKDMMNYFEGTNEAQITQPIDRSAKIFGTNGGTYVYAPGVFKITEDDRELICGYLKEAVISEPLNINTALEDLREIYPEFFKRNRIGDKGMLWAALGYMFKDNFKFARPFISKIDRTE